MIDTLPRWIRVLRLLGTGWCQDSHAQDREKHPVLVTDPAACSWCIDGAMLLIGGGRDHDAYKQMVKEADRYINELYPEGEYGNDTYVAWQDVPERTLEDVLDFVATVIERLVEDQQTGRVFADYLKWPNE